MFIVFRKIYSNEERIYWMRKIEYYKLWIIDNEWLGGKTSFLWVRGSNLDTGQNFYGLRFSSVLGRKFTGLFRVRGISHREVQMTNKKKHWYIEIKRHNTVINFWKLSLWSLFFFLYLREPNNQITNRFGILFVKQIF